MSSVYPDLSSAKVLLERIMVDRCEIRRPADAVETFDEATGEVTTGEAPLIYGAATLGDGGRALEGRCLISDRTDVARSMSEGGVDMQKTTFIVTIPWDAPEIRRDDVLSVLSSVRDPQLAGVRMLMRIAIKKTMLVSRKLVMERM